MLNKKLNIVMLLFGLMIMFCMSVSAATISNSFINTSANNISISVNNTWTYDSLTIDSTSFTIRNMTQDISVNANDETTFNFSIAHARAYGSSFPYFTSSTVFSKNMYHNLTTNLNVTTNLYVRDCNIQTLYYSINGGQAVTPSFTCSGTEAILSVPDVPSGNTQFTISYSTNTSNCSTNDSALWAIIILVFLVGTFYYLYRTFFEFNIVNLGVAVLMSTITIVIIYAMITMLKTVC